MRLRLANAAPTAAILLTILIYGCGGAQSVGSPAALATPTPPSGTLRDPRFAMTMTVLQDGKVLAAGGVSFEGTSSTTAEIYDPATGGFMLTGGMLSGRAYHTATLLADGKVLIAGGIGKDGRPVRAAELYDPALGEFTPTGNMLEARFNHAAARLPNGKVLITGGEITTNGFTAIDTAELYDPASGGFTPTGDVRRYYDPELNLFYYEGKMAAARTKHTATPLPDGRVLIAGGADMRRNALASAELYDPQSGKFGAAPPMSYPRQEHRATRLRNGSVLLTGGLDSAGHVLSTAEIFDPSSGKFTLTTRAFPAGTNMAMARYEHTATLLDNGEVLLAGGSDSNSVLASAELYDPSRGSFTCVGGRAASGGCANSMTAARDLASASRLPDGSVLIAGGYSMRAAMMLIRSAEIYNSGAGTFNSVMNLLRARYGMGPEANPR